MELSPKQLQLGKFWRKYLRLTRSGVPTLRGLEIILKEEPSPEFRGIVQSLHDELEDGSLLSEAMEKFPEDFSLSAIEMIRTAEKEGHWDLVVQELADGYLEGTFE
jgi:type II secretory pathway component PulF